MGVAQLHEACALVGRGAVDGPGKMQRIVGDDADRPAFNSDQRRDHAVAKATPDLEERSVVGQRMDQLIGDIGRVGRPD